MIGYGSYNLFRSKLSALGMSKPVTEIWAKMMLYIANASDGPAHAMLDAIVDVLPVALTVAGAILVVTLGWRLFRNFTRG